jgi:hypothetical protein
VGVRALQVSLEGGPLAPGLKRMAKSKESRAASLLAQARWEKMPDAKERSKLMRKVRAARTNAAGGRNGGRPKLEDRCYCGLRTWASGVTRRFDCCKRAGKYPAKGGK